MPAPYQPLELAEDTAESFNLKKIAEGLMSDKAFRDSGRVARTLVRSDRMTSVVTVVNEGAEIHEHATDSPAMIAVLSGNLIVTAGKKDRTHSLPAGSAVVLAAACPHRVKATEPTAFLLVMGGRH
jgi:quercetin dioxygenase-like cupin family protein